MKFTLEQYKTLGERFNEKSFLGKLVLIKQQKDLFEIESDGYNIRLRLLDDEAMNLGLDKYFSFPEFLEYEHLRDICKLTDLNIKELK
jgi:hypothetical protein